jgi:hypothetical protein
MDKWWYNTSYHTSLKLTPFQALYVFPPPILDSVVQDAKDMMQARLTALQNIKQNMILAQNRMKKNVDKKRTGRELSIGDMAYVKMQP